jgi:NOL1/NOP2/sun family putative RNA methylase
MKSPVWLCSSKKYLISELEVDPVTKGIEPIFECYREIIPEFLNFQESLRRPLPMHLRVNRLKIEPESLVQLLAKKGVHLKRVDDRDETLFLAPGLKSAGNLLEYFLGYVHPQALTSCLASLVLSVKPASLVLDMCASPGGKTSHMAQLMNNTGLIIANELYSNRQIPLAHTLSRLGVFNTLITNYQAQEFPLKERFDYVLADVPCSGEGIFRATQEASGHRKNRRGGKLPELQKRMIIRGFDLLKREGEMVYSTCTYDPEENESVVAFLLRHRDAELLPINGAFPSEPGLCEWNREKHDRRLQRSARFYPHRLDSVGFFMARIGRRG